MHIYLVISFFIHLFIFSFTYLFIYSFIHLFVCLFYIYNKIIITIWGIIIIFEMGKCLGLPNQDWLSRSSFIDFSFVKNQYNTNDMICISNF